MLGFLFRGLTAEPGRGASLFESITEAARRPHWYVEGQIPDTFDGRFALLSTITALAIVRVEREGRAGDRVSVALTERFIEVMESEHRELGLGDPTLGRTVRKLVSLLARKVDLWRKATQGEADWFAASRESLYKSELEPDALRRSAEALKQLWSELSKTGLNELEQGKIE
ncbi:MAG TPA: ubiquinol-cytochrome C chaperone family protein [Sphingomicrobium sp.]|nr:ubiquinol-cytochrome C chaperone family protein [Sphingomicrobium sp.]